MLLVEGKCPDELLKVESGFLVNTTNLHDGCHADPAQ